MEMEHTPLNASEEAAPAANTNGKKKKGSKLVYYILIGFFALVFIGSGAYLTAELISRGQAQGNYNDLSSLRDQLLGELPTDPLTGLIVHPNDGSTSGGTGNSVILKELQPIYEINSDLVGWIYIPGTNINYPVVQTDINNRDYYLHRDFNKEYSDMGCLYVREQCDVFTPSDNVTIYGHHMQTGEMFAKLDRYRKQEFWKEHQYLSFDTLYERHNYQIVAVFRTSGNAGEGFAYHQMENAANEDEFNEFVATIHKLAMYDTGIPIVYGDMLLCLSTCEYTTDNGRFVVVAKRIS